MQRCCMAAVGFCGMQGFGDAEGKLLGHLSVLCPAGTGRVLGLGAPQGRHSLVVSGAVQGSTEGTARGTRDEVFISVD